MNPRRSKAALYAIGLIAIQASVNALARTYPGRYDWAIHHRLGGRRATSLPAEIDVFPTSGKLGQIQPLHAMESRPVHRSPRQFTRDPAEQVIRSDCITSVHASSPRTVTSLVTSCRDAPGCRANPSLFRITRPGQAGLLPRLVRQDSQAPSSPQCTPDRPDRTASAHARRSA
jgi:hypothetical protein